METVPELENEMEETSASPESFSEVRKKRKRSKVLDMDTGEGDTVELGDEDKMTAAKRPAFPPVDASTIVVSTQCLVCISCM